MGKQAGWTGTKKTAQSFRSKEFGKIDSEPDNGELKDIGERLSKELTPRSEHDNTHVICGVTNSNKEFIKFPEEIIRESFMFDNDLDFRYACDELYQSGASYIAAVHGGNPKMKSSNQTDETSKPTRQTSKSEVNYYTWGHNVNGALENGSYVREQNGKLAQYMNGDFMGYISSIPEEMTKVDKALALRLIPKVSI